ncbi:MAG: hypothetical protein ACREDV_09790 [Methylocella sp.]
MATAGNGSGARLLEFLERKFQAGGGPWARRSARQAEDPCADYFDRGAKLAQTTRLAGRLQSLGYTVKITPMAA